MTTKLDIIRKLLEQQEIPKKDVSYADFDKIVSLIEKEQVKELVQMLNASFSTGVSDVRLIFYYLYIHFLENGIQSFQETLPFTHKLVEDYYPLLKPRDKIDAHFETSLGWFLSRVVHKFKTIEKTLKGGKIHPIWEKSKEKMQEEQFVELQRVLRQFSSFFYQKWPASPLKEKVMHLVKRVEDSKELLLKKEVKSEIEQEAESIEEEAQEEAAIKSPPIVLKEEEKEISKPFDLLVKKMKVFEMLIEKKAFFKASIVSKDISHIIDNFDPSLYFPKLFATYFATLAQAISSLSMEWNQQDSLKWTYFNKLYQTDIDTFVETND